MAVPNTDNIETTTLQLIRKRMADNIFKANPTVAWFMSRGRVQTESGGRFIPEPLMYATNQTVQSYRGYDRLNVAPTEELTQAQYNWRQMAVSIPISGEEEIQNAGSSRIFNLLESKIKVAEMSLSQYIDEKMHAATSTKDTNKEILGFDEIIDDLLNYSTLGSIDGNTYTFWQNQLGPAGDGTAASGFTGSGESDDPVIISATSTVALSQLLTRMYNNCAKGSADKPDLIITAQNVYERYENDARDKLRMQDTRMAELGFDNQRFKSATMMWNENIKTATDVDVRPIYFINSKYMRFVLHSARNFKMSSFVSPWDQDARVAQILIAGQMTCSNRRRLGVTWVDISP